MAETQFPQDKQCLSYKGRPLVRYNNIILYGNPKDEYILRMTVITEKEVDGNKIPDRILVQIQKTAADIPEKDRTVQQTMTNGLYNAFDTGVVWLEQKLKP